MSRHATPRMKTERKKSFWRWSLYLAIGVAVLIALLLVEEHVRGRIMLRRWTEQMRASGERFTLPEVLPAAPRMEDNAAPYLAPLPVGFVIPNAVPAGMRYVAPGKCVVVPKRGEWFFSGFKTQFTTNGFREGPPRVRGNVGRPSNGAPFNICVAADLEADFVAASNALASVKSGMRKSALDFNLDYSAGFNLNFGHLQAQRQAAQWLRAASLLALMQTNHATSLDHLLDLLRLVRLQTNGTLLIDQSVRVGLLQMAAGCTWEALQVDGWNDEQLAALHAAWQTESSPWLARACEVERIIGCEEVDRVAELGPDRIMGWIFGPAAAPAARVPGTSPIEQFFEEMSHIPDKAGAALFRAVYFPVWRVAWKDQDKLNLSRAWQPAIEAARKQTAHPNWRVHRTLVPPEDNPPQENVKGRARFLVSGLLQGPSLGSPRRAIDAEASCALVQTAIALHRWKLKHGGFPTTLDELVPGLLPALPVDPFDGQPLRYQRGTNAPFTLYSVGHNCVDDHGDARSQSGSNATFLLARDIVWPTPATAEEIEASERVRR